MDLSEIFEFPNVITTASNEDVPSLEDILKLWNINNNLKNIDCQDGIMNDKTDHDTLLINYYKLCANVDKHMNSFKKLCNYGYSRTLKTVPV